MPDVSSAPDLDGIQAIMIDDGSLDRSSDIAKDFADRYDNFEYIRQVNGGLGNARNTGIQYAKGKYIIFLDSDDIVPVMLMRECIWPQRETTVIWWLDMYLDLIPKKKEYQIYMNLPSKIFRQDSYYRKYRFNLRYNIME